jgi:hypothetical protein
LPARLTVVGGLALASTGHLIVTSERAVLRVDLP